MSDSLPIVEKSSCQCGCGSESLPVLDVLTVPPVIRHATILGSLKYVPAGTAFAIKAPHNPTPLLSQIEAEFGSAIQAEYVEAGPQSWTIKLTKLK